ncbi:hypothetical protein WMF28_09550 [Sorangium sp. So ce590]|uniref:hypothetical protein n=1 Tax=Sorangium sp. So ce590 TaxID=3133317 RepID=UPI003F64008E
MADKTNPLIDELGAATRLVADHPEVALQQFSSIRDRALRVGDIRCASLSARLLLMAMSDREWIDQYAERLLLEEPSSQNYLAVAGARERVGLLSESLAAYERAAEIESQTGGDPELTEWARGGCERLRARISSPKP